MEIIKWTDIEAFYNIRKYVLAYPNLLGEKDTVVYRAKVKLHGSNSAVRVFKDGRVFAQSRTQIISTTNDNAGFAKWVAANEDQWSGIDTGGADEIIIFGEWCGPGVQKGVAVNQIPNKVFAVFAIQTMPDQQLIVNPDIISSLIGTLDNVYILPWHGSELQVYWPGSDESLQAPIDQCNAAVAEVEKCDPWVKENFGIEGLGEGLVYYPVSHIGLENFKNLCFKAKGEKHKVVASKNSAQANPEKAEGVDAFAALVLTEARLEQGVRAIANGELLYDIKNVGKFIGWVSQDVSKETVDELQASGLEWKQVSRTIDNKARTWYLNNARKL